MFEYLDVGQAPIHWKDFGGEGPTIVLVHGLGGSVATWDVVGPRLASDHRVVALDLPGFGLSPPWADYELETHVLAVTSFIEAIGGANTLVGNSLGGLLAEMVASSRPDLVDSLVLVAPATPPRLPDPRIDWQMATRLALSAIPGVGVAISKRVLSSRTPEQLIKESLDRITYQTSRVPLDMIDALVKVAELRSNLPWAALAVPKTGQSIMRYFATPSRFVAMVRDIKAPTLVVQGVSDPIVSPTTVEWVCSLRPDWELVQLDETGHTPQIDAPIRLLAVIEPWLDGLRNRQLSA